MKKAAYLGLGSNLGDREVNISRAIKELQKLGEITAVSSLYETEPVELTAQPRFLNSVIALETELMPRQLLTAVLAVEQGMGRRRNRPKGPRNIDIDILLFGNSIIDTTGMKVPHPALDQRRFVLEPLAEIAPDVIHPVLKRTVRELRDALPAGPSVKRWSASSHRGG